MADEDFYTVVSAKKGYLSGMVRSEIDTLLPITKEEVIKALTSLVHFASKARYRGCLVVLACLLDSYDRKEDEFIIVNDNGKPTRLVEQCFNPTHGLASFRGKREVPNRVVEQFENCFPAELVVDDNRDLPTGYSSFTTDLAQNYATCAANHLRSNFFIYQRRSVINLLQSLGHKNPKRSCPEIIEDIMRRINNWNTNNVDDDDDLQDDIVPDDNDEAIVESDTINEFVEFHRSFFRKRGLQEALIDDVWVDHNLKYIGLYFVHILSYQGRLERRASNGGTMLKVKRFHVLPVHKITAGHISFDSKCFFYMLKMAGLKHGRYNCGRQLIFPNSEKNCANEMKNWWSAIFRIEKGISANRMHYAPMGIRTNGITASMLYVNYLDKSVIDNAQNVQENILEVDEEEELVEDVVPVGLAPLQDQDEPFQDVPEDAQADEPPSQVLQHAHGGVDPGIVSMWFMVCTTIPTGPSARMDDENMFSIENVPGCFEYTSAAYRHDGRVSYLMDHIKSVQNAIGLPRVYLSLSKHHLKTPTLRSLYRSIHYRTNDSVWEKLWAYGFKKSVLRAREYVSGQKESCKQKKMNQIINKMSDAGCEVKSVGFGNGAFRSSYRGIVGGGVPTQSNKELFARNFNAIEVDEFRTSSVCPRCECQLHNLFHIYKGKRFYIRGIKFCSSVKCANHRFWHRDQVGAINILKRHLVDQGLLNEENIPYYLQREASVEWRSNRGAANQIQFKSSRPCILPRKKQKQIARERRKAKKLRKRNRVKQQNE